jgi:UDP-N-acetylmuramate--alanine ligase
MNGADMKNFIDVDSPFASARVGDGDVFVSEVDESDGSIAFFEPRVAAVNNISLDHKSLEELRTLFRDFIAKGRRCAHDARWGSAVSIFPQAWRYCAAISSGPTNLPALSRGSWPAMKSCLPLAATMCE